ncbi:hypothetical protein GEMRC1_003529 [Eukaryota sp. GEM-RC1]
MHLLKVLSTFCHSIYQTICYFDSSISDALTVNHVTQFFLQLIQMHHTGLTLPVIVSDIHHSFTVLQRSITNLPQKKLPVFNFSDPWSQSKLFGRDVLLHCPLTTFSAICSFETLSTFKFDTSDDPRFVLLTQYHSDFLSSNLSLSLLSFGKVFPHNNYHIVIPSILFLSSNNSLFNSIKASINFNPDDFTVIGSISNVTPPHLSLNVTAPPYTRFRCGVRIPHEALSDETIANTVNYYGNTFNVCFDNKFCFAQDFLNNNDDLFVSNLCYQAMSKSCMLTSQSLIIWKKNISLNNDILIDFGIITNLTALKEDAANSMQSITIKGQNDSTLTFITNSATIGLSIGTLIGVSWRPIKHKKMAIELWNLSQLQGLLYLPEFKTSCISSEQINSDVDVFITRGNVLKVHRKCATVVEHQTNQNLKISFLNIATPEIGKNFCFLLTNLEGNYYCSAFVKDTTI